MIHIFSPAKVNLTLDVKPKTKGSNFHQIETIYHKLNWGDRISIETADKFEILGDFDCALEDNLIYKAWLLISRDRSRHTTLNTETGLESLPAVKVTVDKQVPTGAGLGGGSSNAAYFVIGYYKLFNLGAISEKLKQSLSDLGKDIPFFLQPEPCALGSHFGDIVSALPFNFSGQTIYLYFQDNKSDTAQAYAQLKDFNSSYTADFLKAPNLDLCGNIFQQNTEHNNCSIITLSGSGSTFYSFEKINIPGCKIIKTQLL